MNHLNSIFLEGRITGAASFSCPERKALCRFVIGTDRFTEQKSGRKKEVSYFEVEAQGRTAEYCNKYVLEGKIVRIIGFLKQRRREGTDGKPCSRISVIAEHAEFMPEKGV